MGLSGITALVGPIYWLTVKNKKNPDNKRDALSNLVLFWGMSYGFYRIANYNLSQAAGHSGGKRFVRNFLELHAAYVLPIFAHYFVEKHFFRGKKSSKLDTSFMLTPTNASVLVHFK